MIVEDTIDQPTGYHYLFRRGGNNATDREGAEKHLAAQGCTRVLHFADPSGIHASFGYIERVEVLRQRAMEPRYG